MRALRKRPKKEWVTFDKCEDLLDDLGLTNACFMAITGTSEGTFYLWKRKYKLPATAISAVKEQLAKYYYKEYNSKLKLIWKDVEEDEID